MKFLAYLLAYSLTWLLHLLPEFLLYRISDLMFFLGYHVAGYRRKVVMGNLKNAFPEQSAAERTRLARRFYRHLFDTLLESAVFPFLSVEAARKRIRYKNPKVLEDLYKRKPMVMAVCGHYGNWEYYSSLGFSTPYTFLAIYKPLRNRWIDRWFQKNRTRFGARVSPMERIARDLFQAQKAGEHCLTLLLADQRPLYKKIQYWTTFLNQDTPVFLGSEKLARKFDAAVVFLHMKKTRRGRYEVECEILCEDPAGRPEHWITEAHVKRLEARIREEPAHWLWSHRRWKHSRERFLSEKEKAGENA
ncbi:MAG: lysophospholipid acyltransferase family protein [Bacteroidales bacterium]